MRGRLLHEPALLPGKAIVRPPLPVGRDNFRAGLLICRSEEAIGTFIAHCDIAARDLLLPYGDLVIVLSTVLRIKRTLDGAEIDKIISDVDWRSSVGGARIGASASWPRAACARNVIIVMVWTRSDAVVGNIGRLAGGTRPDDRAPTCISSGLFCWTIAQMSALGCEAEIICSIRALPVLTAPVWKRENWRRRTYFSNHAALELNILFTVSETANKGMPFSAI